MKKPSLIYMQNPNLIYSIMHGEVTQSVLHRTFFCNQVEYNNQVHFDKKADFLVNEKYRFVVAGQNEKRKCKGDHCYYARDMIEVGEGNEIPLWLIGFLY